MAARGSTKKPTMLTAEAILSKNDLEERIIDVPEWGGAVKIRALGKRLYNDITQNAKVRGELDEFKFEMGLLQAGIVEPSFTLDQIGQLQEKSVGAVDRVVSEIMEISGLTTRMMAAFEAAFRDES